MGSVSSLTRTTTVCWAKVISCQRPVNVRLNKNTGGYCCADGNGSLVITGSKLPFTPRRWIRCLSLSRKSPSMFRSSTRFKHLGFPSSSPFLTTLASTGRPSMPNTYATLLGSREPRRRIRGWPRRLCIRREDSMARRRADTMS